ncbi:MAG: formylglycine-generating enzyme family protein, partial [Aestuariibacter sp.]|nr:formylglycine-generating enzyme family protein [Aestuariibacter sp.]
FPGCDNPYGLLDMNGNVWEWVEDDHHHDYKGAPEDGSAWIDTPERSVYRVIRGGSWASGAGICRSAFRYGYGPDYRDYNTGFRLVLPRLAELKHK